MRSRQINCEPTATADAAIHFISRLLIRFISFISFRSAVRQHGRERTRSHDDHRAAAGPAAGRETGACRYPGCPNPARDPGAPGRKPGYCGQEMPEDRDGTAVLVRHTALTAFRRRQQLAGQPDDGGPPVTAAISRAGAIRDDALAAMSRLGAQLTAALDQLAVLGEQLAAAGPEAAEAQAETVRAETAAQLEHARAESAGHAAARHAAELDAAEARTAAAEAIAMLEEHAARKRADPRRARRARRGTRRRPRHGQPARAGTAAARRRARRPARPARPRRGRPRPRARPPARDHRPAPRPDPRPGQHGRQDRGPPPARRAVITAGSRGGPTARPEAGPEREKEQHR